MMPKLSYTNPLSGRTGNLLDVGGLVRLLLGGVVLFGVFTAGQALWNRLRGVLGGVPVVGGLVRPPAPSPSPESQYEILA